MRRYLSLIIIACCLPIIIMGVCDILPTFDDYTSLQSTWYIQIADPGYFFPDAVRRPFDFLFGCLLGYFPTFFPTLNHIVIILGHSASAFLVYAICRRLKLDNLAANIATLYFFFSPATLGATLACDGLNQTYAQLWGLLALWVYLGKHQRLWIACIIMAVLSKENGLAWAVVPPLVAYAFHLSGRRQTIRNTGIGLLIAFIYLITFFVISHIGILHIEYADEYSQSTLFSHLKDFIQLMAYTWVPLDYMSAVYQPARNWIIVVVTALMSVPFLFMLIRKWQLLKSRELPLLILCFFIVASPHLVTLVSMMHNYAALSMAAFIVAFMVNETKEKTWFITTFSFYLAAALFTVLHHFQAARQSGLLSQELAMQVISQADKPLERVVCINIDDETEPRYSNFCVRPVDAFAWGLSVRHHSHYTWKTDITNITLPQYNHQQIEMLADSALNNSFEAVWVVGHHPSKLLIIKNEQK